MKSIVLGAQFPTPWSGSSFLPLPTVTRTGFSAGMRQLDSWNRVLADDKTVYLLHFSICSSSKALNLLEKFDLLRN
jgi:hypothetical protein